MALSLPYICNFALQALEYEVLDGGKVFFRVDEFLLLVDEGVHIIDEEDEQHLAMVLTLQGLKVEHGEDVLIDVLLLLGVTVIVDEVVLEISLYELDCVFVLWLEDAVCEDLEDDLQL